MARDPSNPFAVFDPEPRSGPYNYREIYTQLGIGDCGHVVEAWPQVTDFSGRNARVICDDCTREKYGLNAGDQLVIVNLVEKKKTPPPKEVFRKPRKKATPKVKTGLAALFDEAGL